jgi:hypothetical protein
MSVPIVSGTRSNTAGHPPEFEVEMSMPEQKEELPFEGCCDLTERELRNALQDITYIRENKPEAKTPVFFF